MHKNTPRNKVARMWSSVLYHWKKLTTSPYGFGNVGMQDGSLKVGITKNYFNSCAELPFKIFVKCFVDKEYALLGQGDEEYLEDLWIMLYSEFCVVSEDEDVSYWIDDYVQVTTLEDLIFRSQTFVNMLIDGYSDEAVSNLKKLGFHYPFTKDSYIEDLHNAITKIQNWESKVKMLKTDIKNKQGDKPTTYATFDKNITMIEQVFKYPINVDTLTTQMYAVKLLSLKEYMNKMEANGTD